MDESIVVTALDARARFGKLLRRVEDEGRSLVIVKRGRPRALLLSAGTICASPFRNRMCFASLGKNPKRSAQIGWAVPESIES
jgi:prevent-host-death family protein